MVEATFAPNLTLHEVKVKFTLSETQDEQFFWECKHNLPELSEEEERSLAQLKAEYLHLAEFPMPENLVKMVVLSPSG